MMVFRGRAKAGRVPVRVRKALLYMQSGLSAIIAVMLIAGALTICQGGEERRSGGSLADMYTTETIADAFMPVVPVLALAVVSTIACIVKGTRNEERDFVARVEVAEGFGQCVGTESGQGEHLRAVRLVVLVIAAVCVVAGILNGSMGDVFVKATQICTECIGLG